jgi:hypothetical protein
MLIKKTRPALGRPDILSLLVPGLVVLVMLISELHAHLSVFDGVVRSFDCCGAVSAFIGLSLLQVLAGFSQRFQGCFHVRLFFYGSRCCGSRVGSGRFGRYRCPAECA